MIELNNLKILRKMKYMKDIFPDLLSNKLLGRVVLSNPLFIITVVTKSLTVHATVEAIKRDIAEIKAKLSNPDLHNNPAPITIPDLSTSEGHLDTLLITDPDTAPTSAHHPAQLDQQDISVTDLEEEMSDIELDNHLNCG